MIEQVIQSVHGLILNHLPVRTTRTPSGWQSFNCPVCTDKRKRGGVIIDGARISYHCFNCGFKAGWSPSPHLSKKYKKLSSSLGASDSEIQVTQLALLEHSTDLYDCDDATHSYDFKKFEHVDLPEDTRSIEDLSDDHELKQYAQHRAILGLYPLLQFPGTAYKRRVVVPFTYNSELIGWSARHIDPPDKQTPKFLSNHPPGYVFNIDQFADTQRKIVVVVEGLFDAILVDGIAVMSNKMSPEQAHLIESLNKQVIVCPDRDQAGKNLINQAAELGWSVSFPPWHSDCKDAADACARYGRLATLQSIITHATDNKIKIQVQSKML